MRIRGQNLNETNDFPKNRSHSWLRSLRSDSFGKAIAPFATILSSLLHHRTIRNSWDPQSESDRIGGSEIPWIIE